MGAVEEEGDDGIAADVAGDVLLGVVGPHLLLVDVFFEDVAEHVGVDLIVVAEGAVVEMPLVGVEEGEDLLECFVGDVDLRVIALQVMHVKKAAVEVGDAAEQRGQFRGAVGFRQPQPLVEQFDKEDAVEAGEPARAMLASHGLEAVAQVVGVAVKEAALLDEVDEHHAIEHQRGVPLAVGQFFDALDKVEKGLMLHLETVVKTFGDLFDIEDGAHAGGRVDNGYIGFLVEGEDNRFQLLDERFAALAGVVDVGARAFRPARFAFDPKPVLRGCGRGGKR